MPVFVIEQKQAQHGNMRQHCSEPIAPFSGSKYWHLMHSALGFIVHGSGGVDRIVCGQIPLSFFLCLYIKYLSKIV